MVTGAARASARAIVEELAAEGGRPAILELDMEAAEAFAGALRGAGSTRAPTRATSPTARRSRPPRRRSRPSSARATCSSTTPASRCMGPSLDFPEEEWRRSIDVMQTGVFFCCQAFGRQLVEHGGAIVNIASMNAVEAFPMRLAYNAAKAAVVQMTEVLAIEWAQFGVRVNSIGPGVTRTELVDKAIKDGFVDERKIHRPHADEAPGPSAGDRQGGALPGVEEDCELHHRPPADRRRRLDRLWLRPRVTG